MFRGESLTGLCLVDSIFGRILAFENDLITKQIVETGAHTRPELAFVLKYVDAGDTILDVGAHIGTFTIPLARKSAGHAIAIEGDPRNFALLEANIALSGLNGSVLAVNAFVGRPDTEYELERHAENTGRSHLAERTGKTGGTLGKTLDELVGPNINPDIIKLAVQGMELDALMGAERLLRGRPILYVMVSEPHLRDHGRDRAELDRFLRPLGYRYFLNVGKRNAADDLYREAEFEALPLDRGLYNVLAIPKDHPKLARAGHLG